MLASCGEAPKSGSPPPATAPAPEAAAPPPAPEEPAPEAAAPPPSDKRDTHAYELEPRGGSGPQGGVDDFGGGERSAKRARPPAALAPPPPPLAGGAPPPAAAEGPAPAGAPPPAPAPAPAAAPKREQGEWDIVPVFYGTDRAQKPNAQRLDYGSERGRRLELGRALVTVPKVHKVPSIERPWAIRVFNVTLYEEAEDPNRHFTMDEIKSLSEDEFLSLVRDRLKGSARYNDHAFIFVHGYNTSFDYALYRTAQISYDLKFDGAAFAYSWPSGGGIASYTYDRESSGQAEPYLRQFVELVTDKSGAKSVSIIAHSMGNQPMLQVLRDLRRSPPQGVRISQIILAAPDVDRDNFENIARDIQGLATGVTLYAASNDRALTVSRNFYGGIPRAGDVPTTGPLVLPGIDTIDVSASSMDSLGLNHSGYAENNEILKDIAALIASGTRPPKLRTPALEEIMTEKGAYWRYPRLRP
ncbi:MAG: alpha/beta hydrolase [Rhizobiales bacterium]|nr:alpha/beta hydrolase [Hyphomicrobiales bacterium]